VDEGCQLYGRWCVACHGEQGHGDGINAATLSVAPADLTDARLVKRSDQAVEDFIAAGAKASGRKGAMPPFAKTLARYQIRDVVACVRKLQRGPKGP